MLQNLRKLFRRRLSGTESAKQSSSRGAGAATSSAFQTLVHCSLEAGPSWTQPVDNLTLLASADLRYDLADFLRGRYPAFLLPSFLHEGMHHWCFGSPLGTTAALLWLRTHRALVAEGRSGADWDLDVVDDLVRYHSIMRTLRPLAEGMALFAEHDLIPSASEVAPPYFTYASLRFTEAMSAPTGTRIQVADRQFHSMLCRQRFGPGLQAKASLLSHPFDLAKGGYLPGYLLVKMLHAALARRDDRMIETPFFISFLRAYFYQDLAFIGTVLDTSLHDLRISHAVFNAFQLKIARLLDVTLAEIDEFERFFLSRVPDLVGSEAAAFPSFGNSTRERDDGFAAAIRLIDDLQCSELEDEETKILKRFHREIITHRDLFRIASTPVIVEVRTERFIVFADQAAHDAGRPMFAGPAVEGVASGQAAGRAEFWTATTRSESFVLFTRGNELVGFTGSGSDGDGDALDRVRSVAGGAHTMRQGFDADIAASLVGTSAETVLEVALANLDEALALKYAQLGCAASVADVSEVVASMSRHGFFGLLDHDEEQVRLLALFSLAGTNRFHVDQEFAQELGFGDAQLLGKLEVNLKRWRMDLLRGDGWSQVALRI